MKIHIKQSLIFTLSALVLAAAATAFPGIQANAHASHAKTTVQPAASSESAGSRTFHLDDQRLLPNYEDAEELFAGYVHQVFHSGRSTASLKNMNVASRLTGQNKIIYHILKSEIAKVADGTRSSTEFSISVSRLLDKTEYTAAELGLSSTSTREQIINAIGNKIFNFSLNTVMNALLFDSPYELYWLSRTESTIQAGPEYMVDEAGGIFFPADATISFRLPVDNTYAAGTYTTDTSKTRAATTAAANARAIVAAASGKSDYEKLSYYRQQICELTSYNDMAAAGSVSNGSPWQMIYVFDGDTSTNVVCEGYSKAFQYLCDETSFSNANIYSYIVDGTLQSSRGAQPHMWNVVHMGSAGNYLVDVTNSDTDSIGSNGRLFLTGYTSGNSQSGYTIQIPAETRTEGNLIYTRPEVSIVYQYSDDLHSFYTAEELALAQGGILSPELVLDNEAHSHAYETSFYWSDSLEQCSVSLVCRTNPAHTVSDLDCNVTSQMKTPATCIAKGTAVYTARASYEGTEYSDTKQRETNIDLSNHTGRTQIRYERAATATQNGYTGDTYCSDCGTLLAKGDIIPATKAPDNVTDQNSGTSGNTPGSASGNTTTDKDSDHTSGGTTDTSDNTPDQNSGNSSNNAPDSSDNTADQNSGNSSGSIPDPSSNTAADLLEKISAKKSTATIKKGKKIQFQLKNLDAKMVKKITYKSSKKSIAKVSKNGKITGKKAGTATIKAKITLKNGMKKTVSMKIKVRS